MLDPHAIAAMLVTSGALFLFTRERVPIEYSCVAVLAVLVLGFELFPYSAAGAEESSARLRGADFLRAFGNDALITICLLLIAVKGVDVSGALRPIGRLLVRIWSKNRSIALLVTLSLTAALSAFVNNTPIVVMMMPILIGVAHRIGMAPSRILMPFCFATTMGGMTTTIGSSTNLLVVGVAADLGLPRIGMFDFFAPAAVAAVAGIVYLWAVAPRWLPDRPSALAGTAPKIFQAVVEVGDDGQYAGRTLGELMRSIQGKTRLERVQRAGLDLMRLPSLTLRAGDRLHVRGSPEAIRSVQEAAGGTFEAGRLRRGPSERLVEIVVTRNSPLHGKRLSELRRTTLGRLFPVGLQRPGPELTPIEEAGDPQLHVGDVLLMQGQVQDIHDLRESHDYLVLDRSVYVPRTGKAALASAILALAILLAAFGFLPIMVSAFCGVGLMLLTRCLHWDEAWSAIDTRLVLVIVTSLALGTALSETGATGYIAERFVTIAQAWPAPVALSAFLLMIALLNEIVSNNAVAVIGTPIAVSIAEQLGMPVLFGANAGYMTPIGYQTNLLVFTAGGYRFGDFFRVGLPLQILTWFTLSVALSVLYL